MSRNWAQLSICGLLFGLTLCSCKSVNPFISSPSSVAKRFFMNCNAGDYSKASEELSTDERKTFQVEPGEVSGRFKSVCDLISRNGTITSV